MVKDLESLVNKKEKGSIMVGAVVAVASMPLFAYAGTYIGEGMGWLWGNIVDAIPYVRDVAPWCAKRAGLSPGPEFNENLYQTSGAIGGFWGGLAFPWRVLNEYYKNKLPMP